MEREKWSKNIIGRQGHFERKFQVVTLNPNYQINFQFLAICIQSLSKSDTQSNMKVLFLSLWLTLKKKKQGFIEPIIKLATFKGLHCWYHKMIFIWFLISQNYKLTWCSIYLKFVNWSKMINKIFNTIGMWSKGSNHVKLPGADQQIKRGVATQCDTIPKCQK